jgi:uncharacterized protein
MTTATGSRALEADGAGSWRVGGAPAPHLDGCLDVDLESSSLTNTFSVHRLGLEVGEAADAPAVWGAAPPLHPYAMGVLRTLKSERRSGC